MIVFPGKNRLYGDLRQPIVTGFLDIGQGAAAGSSIDSRLDSAN
jgi:hypothetical protein